MQHSNENNGDYSGAAIYESNTKIKVKTRQAPAPPPLKKDKKRKNKQTAKSSTVESVRLQLKIGSKRE